MPPAPPQAAPARTEFQDDHGDPLPPDLQRELQEVFKADLPPPATREAAPTTPPSTLDLSSGGAGEIVVQGQRPRGSVTADIPPERTLNPLDINAYGAGNIGDLIRALGPQIRSNRGREGSAPVTLLNGRRVSSFTEIASIPTEAIERMEVFPEELALQYGYRADQKVVNIVTFERFRSYLGQLGSILATEGGYESSTALASYFAIRGSTRFDLGLEYSRASPLLESERDLIQPDHVPDAARFRTLIAKTERVALTGLVGGELLDGVATTLNGRLEAASFQSLLGGSAAGRLAQDTETRAVQLGTTLHGQLGRWLWTFTGGYDRLVTDIGVDSGDADGARDEARSVNTLAHAGLLLSGSLLKLPAGPLSAHIRGSAELRDFRGNSTRKGIDQRTGLFRESGAIQVNLNAPIARHGRRGRAALGDLSLNATFEVEQLSDYGTLYTYGYGLNWAPDKAVNLVASVATERSAPTMEQLGAPLLVTSNLRTFDFVRREVVDIAQTFGGNRALRSEDRDVFRLGVNLRPLTQTDLTISADYVATRIDHPIVSFPLARPEIEAAFPERFMRSVDGRLLGIDARPINVARSRQEQLRWGFTLVRPLATVDQWMRAAAPRSYSSEADARAAAPPGAIVTMVQPGSALARRFENLASRLFVSIHHSWQLRDEVLLRESLPVLNLLEGSAIDPRGGSRRHGLEAQGGLFKRGLGARATVNWQSGAIVRHLGGTVGDLSFSDLVTVDINFFANLQDRLGGADAPRWLRGMRLTFAITNLFDTRTRVRDRLGSTPLNYQPAYLDPLGRRISLGLRKVF